MGATKIISSDSHVIEPPDLWQERMPKSFGDRVPRLGKGEEAGADDFYVDNRPIGVLIRSLTDAGSRFEDPEGIRLEGGIDEVRAGAWKSGPRLKDMDFDGIYSDLLYPSIILNFWSGVADSELLRGIFVAYNEWLGEFCSENPDRLKGVAQILIDGDVEAGVRDLTQAAKSNMGGAMISVFPRAGEEYTDPMYDPFWAAAEEIGLPLSLHIGTGRAAEGAIGDNKMIKIAATGALRTNIEYWVRMSLCNLIYAGVLDRFPKLRFVQLEHELSWIPLLHRPHGVVLSRAAAAHPLPLQGRRDAARPHAPPGLPQLPGRRPRHPAARNHRRRQPDVGLRLSPRRIDLPQVARDPSTTSSPSARKRRKRRSSPGTRPESTTSRSTKAVSERRSTNEETPKERTESMATQTKVMLMSADNHIVEPPDLWTSRIEKKFRDRAPHVVQGDDHDWWYVEGDQCLGSMGNTTNAGAAVPHRQAPRDPGGGPLGQRAPRRLRPPRGHQGHGPRRRLRRPVIFPTLCVGGVWRTEDSELLSAICRAYNDWIAEFCKPYPDRLKGAAMINVDNIPEAVEELERCKGLGLNSCFITVYPQTRPPVPQPRVRPVLGHRAAPEHAHLPAFGLRPRSPAHEPFHQGRPQPAPRRHLFDQRLLDPPQPDLDDLVGRLRAVPELEGR